MIYSGPGALLVVVPPPSRVTRFWLVGLLSAIGAESGSVFTSNGTQIDSDCGRVSGRVFCDLSLQIL